MFQLIQKLDRGVASAERALVVALTAAITVIMMAQVILRYFFSSPIFWAEEISVQLLVFVTLFGLSLLVHQSQLVTIDFLPRALPLRARHALLAVLGTITLVLFAYIGWLSWEWVQRDDVRIELSATTQLPRWYNYSAVPLALALLVWHQFVAILRDLHVVVKGAAQ
ncbi:MAG: C4-dicarboxylate ABC transporter permease [Burkholderiales bacterium RIFCSPLOWO2_12_FULL_64_99]|nr:MAG: C4-dicarboxylate ABC transporter permease [Burkholderiales bacterium RIFCSPHIGHO2_12_FULL_63_20]OGB67375.1 MAG: C4-dicarboxylate ABC transporter permease [Burkholderiales bacterium RIFCSPLOWO2_12_FULL_64_99]